MHARSKIVTIAAILITASATAHAAPIAPPEIGPTPFNSGSWTRNSISGVVGNTFTEILRRNVLSADDQSGSSETTNPSASVSFSTDIATGSVGAGATLLTNPAFTVAPSRSAIFDTVAFDFDNAESEDVSFSINVDGVLSNSATVDAVTIGGASVRIADVTGLDSSFFILGRENNREGSLLSPNGQEFSDGDFRFVEPDIEAESSGGFAVISPDLEDDVSSGDFKLGIADEFVVSTDGEAIPFERTLNGEFTATEGRLYALLISSSVDIFGTGPSSANLLNTATFNFTNLSGGTFRSASGVLPGSSGILVTDIPTPSTAVLMVFAVLAFFGIARYPQSKTRGD